MQTFLTVPAGVNHAPERVNERRVGPYFPSCQERPGMPNLLKCFAHLPKRSPPPTGKGAQHEAQDSNLYTMRASPHCSSIELAKQTPHSRSGLAVVPSIHGI